MRTFEYKILDDKDGVRADDVESLNFLGSEGWELVAIGPSYSVFGGKRFYLKRELPDFQFKEVSFPQWAGVRADKGE